MARLIYRSVKFQTVLFGSQSGRLFVVRFRTFRRAYLTLLLIVIVIMNFRGIFTAKKRRRLRLFIHSFYRFGLSRSFD